MNKVSEFLNNYKDGVPVNVNVEPRTILYLSGAVITVAAVILLLKHFLS